MTDIKPAVIPGLDDDPLWYKDAIIYEVHVRAYKDSDGDGSGDFKGLTEKLDYLRDLGVTTIWLLPFYPSPLRDDGYDIGDYNSIHPSYGTLRDFRNFMREATRRGLRVITELVVNHTSDQHEWFQRARVNTPGNRWRDFYVWSDTPDKYSDARIIFKDFEKSNWTWDSEAQAYFWHRFYSHQPDLNYENEQVKRAVKRVMDFWLGMGVSGLRLDAVPYLFEEDGTDCENLPKTHGLLKELRQHMDKGFNNRLLLAEANQWPEDAAAYFGQGDECNMNYHFPVMPRMFMALQMEDRYPIVDIMEQTPEIPDNCQWAMFLRNHDELTLEMVTDEERDYMYRAYARDNLMRINLGIRRRLAPLMNNDRRKIELLFGLLFSLPGTPVIYYGDEIGMGDNFYLGDRNGVRTPMQWSPDRNAGFSTANPQSLYFPVIIDPEYHFESVNVEAQNNNPDSMLWWMKRTIALRKRYKAFGRGSIKFLNPDNRKVLAFIRHFEDERILVIANLSRQAQHAFIDLSEYAGWIPSELSGGAIFPVIGEAAYPITLGAFTFYWFSLEPAPVQEVVATSSQVAEEIPTVAISARIADPLCDETRTTLQPAMLRYIRKSRWFGGKARHISTVEIQDVIPINHDSQNASIAMVRVEYSEGEGDVYILPVAYAEGERADALLAENPGLVIARLRQRGGQNERLLFDAMDDDEVLNHLLTAIGRRRTLHGEHGELTGTPTQAFRRLRGSGSGPLKARLLTGEQSNTSVMFEDRFIMKLYRKLGEGVNPDLEIGRFLTDEAGFTNTAPVAGALEYSTRRNAPPATVAVLQGFVSNGGDAWSYTLDALGRFFEWALAHPEIDPANYSAGSILTGNELDEYPEMVQNSIGFYMLTARLLGERTAEMHMALASKRDNPAFAPEPFTDLWRRSLYQSMRNHTNEVLRTLRGQRARLPEDLIEAANQVVASEDEILERFRPILDMRITGMRTRIHGDYHLGQLLHTGNDFVIIDFEGEPARSISERRLKRSPLRDVAGMLRSFHYAANAAMYGQANTIIRPDDLPMLTKWADFWYRWVSVGFMSGYLATASDSAFLPKSKEELRALMEIYLLEKSIYEINYEMNNRPGWVGVPLSGILHLLGKSQ